MDNVNAGAVQMGWPDDVKLAFENEALKKELQEWKDKYAKLQEMCEVAAHQASMHRETTVYVHDESRIAEEQKKAQTLRDMLRQSEDLVARQDEQLKTYYSVIKTQQKYIALLERD